MTGKFKMRPEPKKPTRYVHRREVTLNEGDTLTDILGKIPGGIDPAQIFFESEKHYGYDDLSYEVYLTYPEIESEEDFSERISQWEKKHTLWKKWYKANEEHIVAKLREKKEQASQSRIAREARDLRRLEAEIQQAEKTIKRNSKLLSLKQAKK